MLHFPRGSSLRCLGFHQDEPINSPLLYLEGREKAGLSLVCPLCPYLQLEKLLEVTVATPRAGAGPASLLT